ncbi:hypothetical protein LN249_08985 [Vibrio alginolyticus]|nr:hypothetical protein LN249_08985 [Vibrio alginolyticus]
MKLGGWQRLWLVVVIISGFTASYVAFETRPQISTIEKEWIRSASDVIAEKISDEESREVTGYSIQVNLFENKTDAEIIAWLNKVEINPSSPQRVFSSAVKEINEKFQLQVDELPYRQKDHFTTIAMWWFAVLILIYVLGWSIGWIVRGFRSKEH